MLPYPDIDPIVFQVGPLAVRWYGLMYMVGFIAAWWLGRRRARQPGSSWQQADVDDLIFYCVLGVIIGGRLGWILFYGLEYVAADPWMVVRIWQGGMAFHGGLIGVLAALWLLARNRRKHYADVLDFVAPLPAIGLFAGRIGNFINGELWGRPTEAPWGVHLDASALHASKVDELLRVCERFGISPCELSVHATQLYEACLEGLVLFAVLWWFTAKPRPRLAPSGLFLILYGTFRFAVEFVRLPDENRGYLLFDWVTMGQILSTPMMLVGVALLLFAYRRRTPSGNYAASGTQQP